MHLASAFKERLLSFADDTVMINLQQPAHAMMDTGCWQRLPRHRTPDGVAGIALS